jgi:hypothetical protein
MAKERIARWNFNQEISVLFLYDARIDKANAEPIAQVDLKKIPGWDTMPEWLRVHVVFAVKQMPSDGWGSSKLTPDQKLEGIKADLLDYENATFKKSGGPRVHVQDKINNELVKTCEDILTAFGGKIPKAAITMFTSTVGRITNADIQKELLAKAGLSK